MIPAITIRSGTRGRPLPSFLRFGAGISGSMSFHCTSGTPENLECNDRLLEAEARGGPTQQDWPASSRLIPRTPPSCLEAFLRPALGKECEKAVGDFVAL